MKAELKRLHSPDVHDLRAFKPSDPARFSVFVQAMIGPAGDDSSESFDLTVCTPGRLAAKVESEGPMLGLHHIVVPAFDYDALFNAVQSFCTRCEGATWEDVGPKVGRLGRWEFEPATSASARDDEPLATRSRRETIRRWRRKAAR
jgi:hypothetical protein